MSLTALHLAFLYYSGYNNCEQKLVVSSMPPSPFCRLLTLQPQHTLPEPMDRLDELPPRSASMPSPGTDLPIGRFQPFARKSISRRDSEMVLSEGPITPPMSPGPDDRQHQQPLSQDDIVVMDVIQPSSDAAFPMTPSSQPSNNHEMIVEEEVEMEQDISLDVQVQPSSRSLSREQEDIAGTRSLKLTDFEVRGTLGMFCVPHFCGGVCSSFLSQWLISTRQELARLERCCSFAYARLPNSKSR